MSGKYGRFLLMVLVGLNLCILADAARESFIKGQLTDNTSGTGLSDIRVRVYDSAWDYLPDASTRSDPDGQYITGALDPGMYYLRAVPEYPDMHVAQYWYLALERDAATPVEVTEGTDTEGVNFALILGGCISGSIEDISGEILAGVDLDLYDFNRDWIAAISASTDAGGEYFLGAIPPGTVYLRADPAMENGVQQRYWPDAYYRDDAAPIIVSAGHVLEGIHFILPPGGYIQGTLHQTAGGVAPDCEVAVYSLDWVRQPIHTILSGENGDYLAFGLPNGHFFLRTWPETGTGYTGCYYPNSMEKETALSVQVTVGETTPNIDFQLPEGNYEMTCQILMPWTEFFPGDTFFVTFQVHNDGVSVAEMPIFMLLDIQSAYYFWPSWCYFHPQDAPQIDYSPTDVFAGTNDIKIFPSFTWPDTGVSMDNLQFIGAAVYRDMSQLAAGPAVVEWSFH